MILSRICFIGEFQAGEDLYNTLTDQLGMTDDEIRMIGFKSLVPFFDQNCYAQTIAEYMIDEGTELTSSGNYHFSFDEINERFGTNLPSDKAMLDILTCDTIVEVSNLIYQSILSGNCQRKC